VCVCVCVGWTHNAHNHPLTLSCTFLYEHTIIQMYAHPRTPHIHAYTHTHIYTHAHTYTLSCRSWTATCPLSVAPQTRWHTSSWMPPSSCTDWCVYVCACACTCVHVRVRVCICVYMCVCVEPCHARHVCNSNAADVVRML